MAQCGFIHSMAGWHHWCNGHELGQTPGDAEGQGGLACCSPWGCKELDMTEWLNNNKSNTQYFSYFPCFVCSIASCSSSHLPSGLIFLLPEWSLVGTELFQFSFVWKWLFPFNYWYAAAAVKSLQSSPTLCDPIDGSPLGSSVPGTLQARILEWVEFLI